MPDLLFKFKGRVGRRAADDSFLWWDPVIQYRLSCSMAYPRPGLNEDGVRPPVVALYRSVTGQGLDVNDALRVRQA